MSRMNNRSNPNSQKKSDIPMMSKDELSRHWSQKAEEMGVIQLFRSDGSPIIGATFDKNVDSKTTRMKKRNIHCKLECCSERRPLVSSLPGLAPRTSEFPDPPEPEFTGWQSVEPRSVRRLKTRARFQKEEDTYQRPSVLYAMDD